MLMRMPGSCDGEHGVNMRQSLGKRGTHVASVDARNGDDGARTAAAPARDVDLTARELSRGAAP